MSELTDAIQKGDAARVTELIEADPALLQAHGQVTPILTAIYHGKNDIVLARLTNAGQLDPAFGHGGIRLYDITDPTLPVLLKCMHVFW